MEKYFFVKTAELIVFANFLFICLLCFNMVKHVSLKLFKTNQQKPQEKNTLNLLNVWKAPWKTKAKPNQKKQKQTKKPLHSHQNIPFLFLFVVKDS